jgi:hypothetical protein
MKELWVLGSAVQDITVSIDLEWLVRRNPTVGTAITLDQGLRLKHGTTVTTQNGRSGLQEFRAQIDIPRIKDDLKSKLFKDGFYVLAGGGKYTLRNQIQESCSSTKDQAAVFLPCEDVSWGGGGLNVARYIRALAPDPGRVPLVYSDVAMNPPLSDSTLQWPRDAEQILVETGDDRCLEAYLYRHSIDPVLFYPEKAAFRRNWVISSVFGAAREIHNKIVLRGAESNGASGAGKRILDMLNGRSGRLGLVLLNSIRDHELFDAAYGAFKASGAIGMFALTERMQQVAGKLIDDLKSNVTLPPYVLIFNEEELYSFAKRFGVKRTEAPLMQSAEDIPNLVQFAKLVHSIIKRRPHDDMRIYVTLGPRGSLGVDSTGRVIHAASYSKSDAVIYDTNTCGDAYCAAIALLEWARRHGNLGHEIAPKEPDYLESESEMQYFMAVATAAAYCRAISRRAQVDSTEVQDLLEHSYLACKMLDDLFHIQRNAGPQLDDGGRLKESPVAVQWGTTKGLAELMAPTAPPDDHS